MSEPIIITQPPAETSESQTRPRYEPPAVVELGNTRQGVGGNGTVACGNGSLDDLDCTDGGQFFPT